MTKQWQEIVSLDLEQAFWDLMGRTFGYVQDAPSLMDLLLRLMVTDFSLSVRGALPQALSLSCCRSIRWQQPLRF